MNAKDSNTWKTKYQVVITYKVYHQMATIRWSTWKLELTVNDLLPILSLIDSHNRKHKTLANNVATMTVVTAEDVKLEGRDGK